MSENIYSKTNTEIKKHQNNLVKLVCLAVLIVPVVGIYFGWGAACSVIVCFVGGYFHIDRKMDSAKQQNMAIFNQEEHKILSRSRRQASFSSRSSNNSIKTNDSSDFGLLVDPKESTTKIILTPEVKSSIDNGIGKLKHRDFLYQKWNLKSIDGMENKNVFNFHGLPGTGKTLSAKEVARKLDKKLFIVDYAQTESKMVGETEKNISKIFEFAKEQNAVLFLDEADTLVSRRIEDNTSQSRHVNAARNVFMQELDQFDGVVILTTNLFSSFDPALIRRINQNIKFELPTEEMRLEIIKAHIPIEVPTDPDINYKIIAELTHGFSGGDIKNLTRESLTAAVIEELANSGSLDNAKLKQCHLVNEVVKIQKSKNSFTKDDEAKVIGLMNT